jgi:nucleotide-binding universal stress UspA family protein
MRTIIATTDFSPASINAVNYAADMAYMLRAKLTLFHVIPVPIPVNEVPVTAYSLEQSKSDAQKQIDRLKAELLDRTRARVIIHNEMRSGDVISELTQYCSKVKPYVVIMGAETASGIERFFLGAKTVSAVKRLQWPLIIVPPLAKFNNIRKIGLACDFRDVVKSVRVDEIKELVGEFNAELHVLHVSEETRDSFSAQTVEESGLLQEMLGEMHPKYHFINEPVIEQGVIEFTEKNKLDLLIIIPKRHNLIGKVFRQSHSKQLVLQTPVPIMAIHE